MASAAWLKLSGGASSTWSSLSGSAANGGFTLSVPTLSNNDTLAALALAQTFTAAQTMRRDGIGTTSTDGEVLENTTAAAVGAQQNSPRARWNGRGWATTGSTSQSVDFIAELRPIQGAASPSGTWALAASVNGGAYSDTFKVDTGGTTYAGTITLQNNAFVSFYDSQSSMFAGTTTDRSALMATAKAAPYLYLNKNGSIGFGSAAAGTDVFGTQDTLLTRDAAGTFAQRNGTNAQTYNLYGTYTDSLNYERLALSFYSGDAVIGTEKLGTGSTRALRIMIGGTHTWQFSNAGHLLAQTDNTYDIGASGANRPRNVYVAGKVVAPNTAKAWVTFNGTTGAISAAFNVSSVTRNAAGDYTVNFASALADANYSLAGSAKYDTSAGAASSCVVFPYRSATAKQTTACRIVTTGFDGTLFDCVEVSLAIHGT